MRYTQDNNLKQRFLDAVLQTETRSTGRDKEQAKGLPQVHVSELITSLPNSWFKRHGYPEVFSQRSKENMASGVAMQGGLHLPFLRTEVEVRRELAGPDGKPFAELVGHVDGVEYDPQENMEIPFHAPIPWELKTTASAIKYPTSVHYFEQLATYAIMLGSHEGRLITFHRAERGDELFKVGPVGWDEDELESWWWEITRRAYLLLKSTEPPWGEEYKWMEAYYQVPAGYERQLSGVYSGWFGEPL